MKIISSPEFKKDLRQLKRKDSKLTKRIQKQFKLFSLNPQHPSLRTHKLSGNLKNYWSISITRNIRAIYQLQKKDIAYFVEVGSHDEVYGK